MCRDGAGGMRSKSVQPSAGSASASCRNWKRNDILMLCRCTASLSRHSPSRRLHPSSAHLHSSTSLGTLELTPTLLAPDATGVFKLLYTELVNTLRGTPIQRPLSLRVVFDLPRDGEAVRIEEGVPIIESRLIALLGTGVLDAAILFNEIFL
jgi:hypothetical protein